MRETILLIFCIVALSLGGQVLMKKGVTQMGIISLDMLTRSPLAVLQKTFASPLILGGLLFAAAGALLWLVVLSRTDLSYALPLAGGMIYLIVPFISWLFLGEPMTLFRLLGTLLIAGGVYFVSR